MLPSFLHPLEPIDGQAFSAMAEGAAGGAAGSSGALPGFVMQRQELTQWCWAAVSVSVAKFFAPASAWRQCLMASQELGRQCCPPQFLCNKPWYLDRALNRAKCLARMDGHYAKFEHVQAEIASGKPLCCRIGWNGGNNGHFVALDAWSISGQGTKYVHVTDPWFESVDKTYDDFVSAYHAPGDRWTHSYYTQSPAIS